jgi:hypothetical protein
MNALPDPARGDPMHDGIARARAPLAHALAEICPLRPSWRGVPRMRRSQERRPAVRAPTTGMKSPY